MAAKSKAPKTSPTKTAKPTKSKAKPAATRTAKSPKGTKVSKTLFVSVTAPSIQILAEKPKTAGLAIQVASFEEARERAVDHLIAVIEECERQLHFTRRAADLAAYQRGQG